jgi:hypothetical protein
MASYGADQINMWRRAAAYADNILKSTKSASPADGAADQVRVGYQSQNHENARPRCAVSMLTRIDRVIE